MTQSSAVPFLVSVFTDSERKFLFEHPQFKEALAKANDPDLENLGKLGVKLILKGGYVPPQTRPTISPAPTHSEPPSLRG
jgi:hypothetical protein